MTLIALSTAWLIGIAAARYVNLPLELIGFPAVLPLAGLILWKEDAKARRIAACGLFLLLGSARYALSLPNLSDPGHIAAYRDQGEVTLWGKVAGEPDVRDTYTNLRVAVDRVEIEDAEHLVKGEVLVRAPRYPVYMYGDELEVEGKLETPPVFEDFSYRDYLARQGIRGMVAWPKIKLLSRGGGGPITGALLALKSGAKATIARILPEPEASLLTGILLGTETGIPERVQDAFSATGTTHVIAISGFNISVIALMLSGATRRLAGRGWIALMTIAGIWIYALFVGGDPAVTRAAFMGSLYPAARLSGREADIPTGCFLAALVMTLYDPLTLWDVGFQLSFAATLGLILYSRPFQDVGQRGLSRVLPPGWVGRGLGLLREGLLVTVAAQITTLPLLLHYFGQLSLISLLANTLILPAQPAVMFCGGSATVLGMMWLPLGRALGWAVWLPLAYTIRVVEWAARFPWTSVPVERFGPEHVLAWYGILAVLTLWVRQTPDGRRAWRDRLRAQAPAGLLLSGLLVAAVLIWIAVFSLPDGRLHVIFFDVGQGDAILVRTPHGHQILLDGGPAPSALLDKLGRAMPFWDRTLDLVVLTHPDEDHLAGLIPVLERYQVAYVMEPALPHDTPLAQEWDRLLRQREVPHVIGQRAMRISLEDDLLLEVLHPGPALLQGTDADGNNNSLVLRLDYGRSRLLLTGDLEHEGEQALLNTGQGLKSHVLKVAHHGAGSATGEAFLAAVDPQLAVLSVGRDNSFGHPAGELLERLDQRGLSVFRTDEQGDIELITDGMSIWVRTARECTPSE
jgi:competence protein ComEC